MELLATHCVDTFLSIVQKKGGGNAQSAALKSFESVLLKAQQQHAVGFNSNCPWSKMACHFITECLTSLPNSLRNQADFSLNLLLHMQFESQRQSQERRPLQDGRPILPGTHWASLSDLLPDRYLH